MALESGEVEKAKELIFNGLETNPKDSKMWFYGSIYFLKQNKMGIARFYLDRAEELGEKSPGLFANKALYFLQMNQSWKAVIELQRALALDSDHVNSNYLMAEILLNAHNYAGAKKYFKKLAQLGVDLHEYKSLIEEKHE